MTNDNPTPTTHVLALPQVVEVRAFTADYEQLPKFPAHLEPVQIYPYHDDGIVKTEFTIAGRTFRVFEQNSGGPYAEIVTFDVDHLELGPISAEFDSLDEEQNESLNAWLEEVHRRIDTLIYDASVEIVGKLRERLVNIALGREPHEGTKLPATDAAPRNRVQLKAMLLRDPNTLAEAVIEGLAAAGGQPEWDSETIENVLRPFQKIVSDMQMPWVGSTADDYEKANAWRKMSPGWGLLCTECGEENHDCNAEQEDDE